MILLDLPPTFLRVFALLFGLIWGSFLNVVIHRVPRGMSVSHPPSHCPKCNTPIAAYRNVPVFSWLWMGGRASCCGAPIAVRYPLVELLGGALALAIFDLLVMPLPGSTPMTRAGVIFLIHFALALSLVASAFIDLEFMIIPDRFSFGCLALGVVTASLRNMSFKESLAGAAVGFLVVWVPFDLIYSRLRGKVGMGMGDAKLLAVAGAWFGWSGALVVLGAGAVQGSLITLGMIATGRGLEEPEAVRAEREELRAELEAMSPEERAVIEEELGGDPLMEEAGEGLTQARIAFGPFLILAMLQLMLIGPHRVEEWLLGM